MPGLFHRFESRMVEAPGFSLVKPASLVPMALATAVWDAERDAFLSGAEALHLRLPFCRAKARGFHREIAAAASFGRG